MFGKRLKTIERILGSGEIKELVRIGDGVNNNNLYSKNTIHFYLKPLNNLINYKLIKEYEKPRHMYYALTRRGKKLYYKFIHGLNNK